MFENIICQEAIVDSLKNEIASQRLPSSLLLWGPDFSGKLSVALELARVLSCREKEASWGCACKACEEHRLLAHPHTLLIGGRYFYEEACACAQALRKTLGLPARYLFIRAVRKLLRRFDAALWEGKEPDFKKAMPFLAAAEEALAELLPGKELPGEKKTESLIARALEAVKGICGAVNLGSIPIAVLRRASSWAHIGASGAAKLIIIENADRMREASRNCILKILEEPPERLTFILTTTRRSAIMPTILSRLRTYRFFPRGEEADRQVLTKIFREEYPAGSLRDFFRSSRGVNPGAAQAYAKSFFVNAASRGEAFAGFFDGDPSWLTDKTLFRIFLQELLGVLRSLLRGEGIQEEFPVNKLQEWAALVRRTLESLEILNIAPPLLAQRLYHTLGAP
jgi:DNA polymerase-3 subunit gamma/tau